jgi:hypothetical protein
MRQHMHEVEKLNIVKHSKMSKLTKWQRLTSRCGLMGCTTEKRHLFVSYVLNYVIGPDEHNLCSLAINIYLSGFLSMNICLFPVMPG